MGTNTYNIGLNVTSNGTIEAESKKAASLKHSLEAAATAAKGTSTALNQAYSSKSKALTSYASVDENKEYRNARGTAEATGASSRDFARQAQGLGGLVHVYATLAANTFAASAAFNMLSKAANTENMIKGLTQLSAASGVALTSVARNITKVTEGAISLKDAMQATAQASSAGMSGDQIDRMAKVAQKASQALGRDLPDALSRISRGITKLEPELLDEIGIMTRVDSAYQNYARSVGKSVVNLSDFEKRQAYANAVLAEGERKFGSINLDSTPYDKLTASLNNLANTTGEVLNKALGPLVGLLAESPTALSVVIAGLASVLLNKALPAISQWKKELDDTLEKNVSSAKAKLAQLQESKVAFTRRNKELAEELAENELAKYDKSLEKLKQISSSKVALSLREREVAKASAKAEFDAYNASISKLKTLLSESNISKSSKAYKTVTSTISMSPDKVTEKELANLESTAKRFDSTNKEIAATYRELAASVKTSQTLLDKYNSTKAANSYQMLNSILNKAPQDVTELELNKLESTARKFDGINKNIATTYRELANSIKESKRLEEGYTKAVERNTVVLNARASALSNQARLEREYAAAMQKTMASAILSSVTKTADIEGPVAGFKKLFGSVKEAMTIEGPALNNIPVAMSKTTAALTTLRGLAILTASGVRVLYSALTSVFAILGTLTFAYSLLSSALSTNSKQVDEFNSSLESLDAAGTNTANVLDLINSKSALEHLSPESSQAKANAFNEVSNSLDKVVKGLIAADEAASEFDRFIDGFKTLWGGDLKSKSAETISKSIIDSLNLLEDKDKAQITTKLKDILQVTSLEVESVEDALENLGNEKYKSAILDISKEFSTLNNAVNNSASIITSLQDTFKSAAKNIESSLNALNPTDNISKRALDIMKISEAMDSLDGKVSQLKQFEMFTKMLNSFDQLKTLPPGMGLSLIKYTNQANELAESLAAVDKSISLLTEKEKKHTINMFDSESARASLDMLESIKNLKTLKVDIEIQIEKLNTQLTKATDGMFDYAIEQLDVALNLSAQKMGIEFSKFLLNGTSGLGTARLQANLSNADLEIQKKLLESQLNLAYSNAQLRAAIEENSARVQAASLSSTGDAKGAAKITAVADSLASVQSVLTAIQNMSSNEAKSYLSNLLKNAKELKPHLASIYASIDGTLGKLHELNVKQAENRITGELDTVKEIYKIKLEGIQAAQQTQALEEKELGMLMATAEGYSAILEQKKEQQLLDKIALDLYKNTLESSQIIESYTIRIKEATDKKVKAQEASNMYEELSLKTTQRKQIEESGVLQLMQNQVDAAKKLVAVKTQSIQDAYSVSKNANDLEQTRLSSTPMDALTKIEAEADLKRKMAAEEYSMQLQLLEIKEKSAIADVSSNDKRADQLLAILDIEKGISDARLGKNVDSDQLNQSATEARRAAEEAITQNYARQRALLEDTYNTTLLKISAEEKSNANLEKQNKLLSLFTNSKASSGIKSVLDANLKMQNTIEQNNKTFDKNEEKRQRANLNATLEGYEEMAAGAKSMVDEKSRAYRVLETVEKAIHIARMAMMVAEMVMTVKSAAADATAAGTSISASLAKAGASTAAGVAKTFEQMGVWGFVGAAAILALMASLGVGKSAKGVASVNTAAYQQEKQGGVGTVLGDSYAKSTTISKGIETLEKNSNDTLDFNNDMVFYLKSINSNISVLTTQLAKQLNLQTGQGWTSSLEGSSFSKTAELDRKIRDIQTVLDPGMLSFTDEVNNFVTKYTGSLHGTSVSTKVTDSGLTGKLTIDDANKFVGVLSEYAKVQVTKKDKLFGATISSSDSSRSVYKELPAEIQNTITKIFEGMSSSIRAGVESLGLTPWADNIMSRLSGMVIDFNASLKGLSTEEQAKALDNIFSANLDSMTKRVLPWIDKFQQAGETAGATLVRLSAETQSINDSFLLIGKQAPSIISVSKMAGNAGESLDYLAEQLVTINTELISAAGGLEQFTEKMSFLQDKFLPETYTTSAVAERLRSRFVELNSSLVSMGYSIPTTRDGFMSIMQSIDITTAAGRELFATLLDLAPAFDAVASASEEIAKTVAEVSARIADMKFSMEYDTKSDQGKYSMIDLRANELNAQMREVDSAGKYVMDIYTAAETANKLLDQINNGWSLLSEEQKKAALPAYQAKLDSIDQYIKERGISALTDLSPDGVSIVKAVSDSTTQIVEAINSLDLTTVLDSQLMKNTDIASLNVLTNMIAASAVSSPGQSTTPDSLFSNVKATVSAFTDSVNNTSRETAGITRDAIHGLVTNTSGLSNVVSNLQAAVSNLNSATRQPVNIVVTAPQGSQVGIK